MPISINGSGSITGLSAGGLPDASITQADLASNVSGVGPAFSAYSASGTPMTHGAYVKVTFDTERYDTNSNFASSRFTPTVAGYYQINSHLVYLTTSSVGQVVLALYKNGGVETYTNFVTHTNTGSSINLSYLISMNGSTDYIEMYFYMSGAGTLSVQAGPQTTFNGFLARAA
jgi:hypothetical protein